MRNPQPVGKAGSSARSTRRSAFGKVTGTTMDVTCERCKAEYEFDDSLLGEGGTSVKCSSCEHVFRVVPPNNGTRPDLTIRYRATGKTESVGSLRDLQRKIRAGEVTHHDEIGRAGHPWRKLADVAELKSFFPSVDEDEKTPPRVSTAGLVAVGQMPAPLPQPNNANSAKKTMLGMGPRTGQSPLQPHVPTIAGFASPQVSKPGAAAQTAPERVRGAQSATGPKSDPAASKALSASEPLPMGEQPTVPAMQTPFVRSSQPPAGLPQPNAAAAARGRSVPPASGTPPEVPSARARALYLSEDEAPPARATEAGSKSWMYIAAAVVLAVGGWISVSALSSRSATKAEPIAPTTPAVPTPANGATTPTDTTAPTTEPTNARTVAIPPHADPAEVAGVGEKTPSPTGTPSTTKTEPAPVEKPASGQATTPKHGEKSEKPETGGASNANASDYAGLVSRAEGLARKGDFVEAIKAYEAALAMRASGAEANAGLGQALLGAGKVREAIAPLERAAKSGYAEAHVTLGDAYRKLGRKDEAEEAYNTYLARLPSGSRAGYVKTQLASLGGAGSKEEPREEEPVVPSPSGDYKPAGEAPAAEEPAP